jgi:A/G-specific adenine glycosylase
LGGVFPETVAGLRELPGVGAYTAAAIAAIAFDRHAAAVDGNVERVMARIYAVGEPLPGAKPRLRALAEAVVPPYRAGDFAQAVMDLGATICTPRRPRCVLCPWREDCAAARAGLAESLPVRAAKPERPLRHGTVFWLTRPDGALLLRRRPEEGLLGGMIELPSTPWRDTPWDAVEALESAPAQAEWEAVPGIVQHGFTHFRIDLSVMAAATTAPPEGIWAPLDRLGEHALPTLTKKVIAHARSALEREENRHPGGGRDPRF